MNKKRILIISAIFIIILGIAIFVFYRNAFSNGSNDKVVSSSNNEDNTSADESESNKRIPMSEVYKDEPMALKILYYNDEPTKKVVFSTGTEKFTEDSFIEYKDELFSIFFSGSWMGLIENIEEMLNTYDIYSVGYHDRRPFEVFLWELYKNGLCYNYHGFRNIGQTRDFLKDVDSPEIILYPYLYLDFVDQYAMIQNKNSNILFSNEPIVYNENFFYNGVVYVDLELEENVEKLFGEEEVPTNVNTFQISFELEGVEYNLYYTQSKDTKEINYIYLESNSEERMTIYEYYFYQYLNLDPE